MSDLEVISIPSDPEKPIKVVGTAHRNGGDAIMIRLHCLPMGPLMVIRERIDDGDAELAAAVRTWNEEVDGDE